MFVVIPCILEASVHLVVCDVSASAGVGWDHADRRRVNTFFLLFFHLHSEVRTTMIFSREGKGSAVLFRRRLWSRIMLVTYYMV